jgi:hypothetical protein
MQNVMGRLMTNRPHVRSKFDVAWQLLLALNDVSARCCVWLALMADGVDYDCKLLWLGFASAVLKGVEKLWMCKAETCCIEKATAHQQTGACDKGFVCSWLAMKGPAMVVSASMLYAVYSITGLGLASYPYACLAFQCALCRVHGSSSDDDEVQQFCCDTCFKRSQFWLVS